MKKTIILVSILFLSLLLRLYGITVTPPSLSWDEISHGYNAYSVLKTGSDEWGKSYPLDNFRAYGDYPLPVNLYLTIPPIVLFGLTEVSIRLPSILLGALLVIPGYFLVFSVTKKKKVALLSALLLAVSPWTILPSRAVFQSTIALFFVTGALAAFFYSEDNPWLLPVASLLYGISAYSYHNARIVSVVLLPFLIVYFLKVILPRWQGKRTVLMASVGILALFFVPLIFILTSTSGRARADWVFLVDQGAINQIENLRNHSSFPPTLTRLLYNKVTYFAVQGTKNYLGYFSPQFLFISGGTQYQYSVPGFGLLFPIFLPFFYFGLLGLIGKAIKKRDARLGLVLIFLFLAPVPGAITLGEDHVLRSALMIPVVVLIISWAVVGIISFVNRRRPILARALIFVVVITSLWSSLSYLENLFSSYPVTYSWSWQYGYREVVAYVKDHYNDYDRFIITKRYGEPHEFVLFFWPWDPAAYKSDSHLVRYLRSDWYWVDSFDKFIFVNDWEIKDKEKSMTIPGKTLLITSPDNYTSGEKIRTINFLDGKPAFDLVKL